MKTLGILDLLQLRGYDPTLPAKLVRHQDARYNVNDLLRNGWFDIYQGGQSKPKFDGCQFIVSFVGLEGSKARFIGVYRVHGKRTNVVDIPLPPDCPYADWPNLRIFTS